jgi:hypothetical protein
LISFAPWTVGPRGSYTTRCSTDLATDTSALNDTLAGSFTIQVHNAGVLSILAPTGTVPKNSEQVVKYLPPHLHILQKTLITLMFTISVTFLITLLLNNRFNFFKELGIFLLDKIEKRIP